MLAKSIGWVLAGTVAQGVLLNLGLLLFGRNIGPVEFGKYFIAAALANFFVLPLGYGMGSAAAHFLAKREPSSALTMVLAAFGTCSVFLALILGGVRVGLAGVLGISQNIVDSAILFSFALASYLLSENICRGYGYYPILAASRVITAVFFCLMLTGVSLQGGASFTAPLWARAIPYTLVFVFLTGWAIRRRGPLRVNEALPFLKYALTTTVASAASVFFISVDKLIINRVLPTEQIGIYSAYFLASYVMASRVCEVLSSVFFPEASRKVDSPAQSDWVRRRLSSGTWMGLIVLFLAASGAQLLASLILGEKFPVSPTVVMLFALGGSLYGMADLRWWIIAARGMQGARPFALNAFVAVCVLVVAISGLAPKMAVQGAALGLLIASAYSFTASLFYHA